MPIRHPFAPVRTLVLLLAATSAAPAAPPPESGEAATAASGGIRWTIPKEWTAGATRPMRVATYALPAGKGAEPGECGVFYFGRGRGGSADENVARWGSQFEGGAPPQTTVETANGLRVHRVSASGTYLAPGGPMMQSQGKKPGYALAGAIVEAPEGLVFFKCTGPSSAITAAKAPLDGMIRSIRRVLVATF